MPRKTPQQQPAVEPKEWVSPEEIDRAISKIQLRINEFESIDIPAADSQDSSLTEVPKRNLRETIRDIFGQNSPEFKEYEYIDLWDGPMYMGMPNHEVIQAKERGKKKIIGLLNGLIGQLSEKRD